ncbi:hypothetical protein COY17_04035 [Candidatus Saccharibacteria bacterium CG_4_10_14_0_2_um_filter_52_9]|nr:MAG: hypothetical protein COY17_04035 [Candidatus Saccharibacteria bacterium CG_4_10_14_0_2_um_filter_52_9]
MHLVSPGEAISKDLTELLLEKGVPKSDYLEIATFDSELGNVVLTDHWNSDHKHYDAARYTPQPNNRRFYEDGYTPILGITINEEDISGSYIFVFRPSDISLSGIGRVIIARDLPEELLDSERIIVTHDELPVKDPNADPVVAQALQILLAA